MSYYVKLSLVHGQSALVSYVALYESEQLETDECFTRLNAVDAEVVQ